MQLDNISDSLKKYSYFIYGGDTNSIESGTCFFYREKNKLYLVTAAHTITGYDPIENRTVDNWPTTFYIRLFRSGETNFEFISFDVSAILKSYTKTPFWDAPDLIILNATNLLKNHKIYSIETFIINYPSKIDISHSEIFGFPVNDSVNDFDKYIRLPASKLEAATSYNFYKKIGWESYGNKIDTLNYRIDNLNRLAKGGFSGSPVFLQIAQHPKIIFGGMTVSKTNEDQSVCVLRPQNIIKAIKAGKIHRVKPISSQ